MGKKVLDTLTKSTFSRSGLIHRIGLLKELLEFSFFSRQEEKVTAETLTVFSEGKDLDRVDLDFLETLKPEFFSFFTKENFYQVLDDSLQEIEALETLSLIVPVDFSGAHIHKIAQWVRTELDPDILLSFEKDTSVAVGCRIVWRDSLHDFSLSRYFDMHASELHKRLALNDKDTHKQEA